MHDGFFRRTALLVMMIGAGVAAESAAESPAAGDASYSADEVGSFLQRADDCRSAAQELNIRSIPISFS